MSELPKFKIENNDISNEKDFVQNYIYPYINNGKFYFDYEDVVSYYVSLKTKPFVILTGISGSGKTKLAQLFAYAMTAPLAGWQKFDILNKSNNTAEPKNTQVLPKIETDNNTSKNHLYTLQAVRPDWVDNKGLMGFYNLITKTFEATDFLKVILHAHLHPELPHFVILDEMNLAKVEYYFSDFLSGIESGEPIILHNQSHYVPINSEFNPKDKDKKNICPCKDKKCSIEKCPNSVWENDDKQNDSEIKYIPPMIKIPKNLYFTGTVNIDESTEPFSKKVLDRANVLEFNDVKFKANVLAFNDVKFKTDENKLTRKCLAEIQSIKANNKEFKQIFYEYFISESHCDREKIKEQYLGKEKPPVNINLLNKSNENDLHKIFAILEQKHMHFGYRVVKEILDFMAKSHYDIPDKEDNKNYLIKNDNCLFDDAHKNNGQICQACDKSFDRQIIQKILPKISGSNEKVAEILLQLYAVCLRPENNSEQPKENSDKEKDVDSKKVKDKKNYFEEAKKLFSEKESSKKLNIDDIWKELKIETKDDKDIFLKYPKSAEKLSRMIDKVFETGNTSFFE